VNTSRYGFKVVRKFPSEPAIRVKKVIMRVSFTDPECLGSSPTWRKVDSKRFLAVVYSPPASQALSSVQAPRHMCTRATVPDLELVYHW